MIKATFETDNGPVTAQLLRFTFYSDPAHGWLEVPRDLLHGLGIADKITRYSYQRMDKVFLEEDCDFTTFARAMKAQGLSFDVMETYTNGDSFIRSLPSYKAEVAA
jgi:hypothetical protein